MTGPAVPEPNSSCDHPGWDPLRSIPPSWRCTRCRTVTEQYPWPKFWTWAEGCTCPYERQPLGQVSGIGTGLEWCGGDMNRRTTAPDCPVHEER